MKKIIIPSAAIAAALVLTPAAAFAHGPIDPQVQDYITCEGAEFKLDNRSSDSAVTYVINGQEFTVEAGGFEGTPVLGLAEVYDITATAEGFERAWSFDAPVCEKPEPKPEPEEPVEEPEEPEAPAFDGVEAYTPTWSVTCDAATWSHPAFRSAFGVATGYHVRYGATQAEAQAGEYIDYTPGEVITIPFEDRETTNAVYIEIKASYEGVTFLHQIGQTRIVSEPCEAPEVPEENAPEDTEETGQVIPETEIVVPPTIAKKVAPTVEPVEVKQANDSDLAVTGANNLWVVGAGAVLLAGGALILWRRRA